MPSIVRHNTFPQCQSSSLNQIQSLSPRDHLDHFDITSNALESKQREDNFNSIKSAVEAKR